VASDPVGADVEEGDDRGSSVQELSIPERAR
jgi:hypothetical protein